MKRFYVVASIPLLLAALILLFALPNVVPTPPAAPITVTTNCFCILLSLNGAAWGPLTPGGDGVRARTSMGSSIVPAVTGHMKPALRKFSEKTRMPGRA